jgi:hypothetical protein
MPIINFFLLLMIIILVVRALVRKNENLKNLDTKQKLKLRQHNNTMLPRSTEPAALQISSEEISWNDAIKCLLSDEDLSDVSLRGTDGVKVTANRCILAARSPVFRRMLFGNFSEASSAVVQVGYTGEVLKALVEYIYMDESSLLEKACEDKSSNDMKQVARKIVSVAAAALYFSLPGLSRKAREVATNLIKRHKKLACEFWKECRAIGPAAVETGIDEIAFEKIRLNPSEAFEDDGLSSLSPLLMEEIVRDEKVNADELTIFNLVKKWSESAPEDTKNAEDHQAAARKITKYIHLELIDPEALNTVVSSSGLVTNAQLFEAFKAQALRAKKQGVHFPKRRRLSSMWKGSQSDIISCEEEMAIATLEYPAMVSGSFRWTFRVEKYGRSIGSGVVLAASNLTVRYCGWPEHLRRWVCFGSGNGHRDLGELTRGNPRYGEGDEVTFVLDIAETASLRYSVNSGPYFPIFTDMHPEQGGFSPVVFVNRGSVRILSIEQLA